MKQPELETEKASEAEHGLPGDCADQTEFLMRRNRYQRQLRVRQFALLAVIIVTIVVWVCPWFALN